MKFTTVVIAAALSLSASAIPVRRGVDRSLVPEFGHQRGLNPTGTGDCDGIPGAPKIPCSCPPDREEFLRQLDANVAAGHAVKNPAAPVSFPTGNSNGDRIARIQASLITLQNLNGPGVGCPAVSTTLLQQQKAIESGQAPPAPPAAPPAAPAAPPAAPANANNIPDNLIPEFGHQQGLNPTGTGDCDGIPGAPKIPCFCPPDRAEFNRQFRANAAAGKVINNPAVPAKFSLDLRDRLNLGLVTLQNMRGPGVGCPAVSTTFLKQLQAL